MAIATNVVLEHNLVGVREDLTDILSLITPEETPFLTGIRKGVAKQSLHEWQQMTLANVSTSNACVAGDDAPTADSAVATTRVNNRCQISRKVILVADGIGDLAGRKSQYALEIATKGMELRRDMEGILLKNQAAVAPGDSTAPKLQGLESVLYTNYNIGGGSGAVGNGTTVSVDGTQRALTESMLKDVLQQIAIAGGRPDTVMLGAFNRGVVSTFTGNATKTIDVKDAKLQASIDIYKGDFGQLKFVWNPVLDATSRGRTAFILEMGKFGVAYKDGRSFKQVPLAKTGDATKTMLISEYTLEHDNQASSGKIADLTTA